MKLIPLVSARLNTKLAEFICKLNIQQNLPKAKDD
jgi:hypothetical protein